tara:strand:+ start:223 stop:720 length:498 start_codon:yes stop_codon:yes gene_type:complete
METTLNELSWHAKLYKRAWGSSHLNDGLPNNICAYFWKTVIALVTFPLWVFGKMLPANYDDPDNCIWHGIRQFFATFIVFFCCLLGSLIIEVIQYLIYGGTDTSQDWWNFALGIPVLAIALFLVFGIIYLVHAIFCGASESDTTKIVTGFISAKKNKYCPRINWK